MTFHQRNYRLICRALIVLGASSLLGACMSLTPNYDTRFGDALRQARLDMTINPQAGLKSGEELMDGISAQQAVDRYHGVPRPAAVAPAPSAPLVNINTGAAGL